MERFFRLCILLFLIASLKGYGQQTELHGKVIDTETKEPIPFANIALKEIYKGTACNLNGEFAFKVDSLPIVLVISHLSYEPVEIEVKNAQSLTVELTPGKLLLDELVIKAKGNDEFAYDLVEKAFSKILSNANKTNFGKAFYRQISKNGDEYSELYEIFYDTKFSDNGVEDWAIQEGRYALKLSTADSFIYNKNFTLMVRLLTIVQPKTDDLCMPISRDVRDKYYLATDHITFVNNRKVAQIRFEVKDEVTTPAMEGEMLIDVDSFEVLKITGAIVHDNLRFIFLNSKSGSWKNYKVTFEIAFKTLDNKELVPDYMQLGQNFDYYIDGVFINKIETKSFFSYYEYYEPENKKKLGGRLMRFGRRDSELLDNIGYNQLFWDENIIVKRTPVESEVIESFEKERAFGSIYLNNKSQIEVEDFTIDKDSYIIRVKKILKDYDLSDKIEKIYLHCDKPYYVTGETIWFKAYAVNAGNFFSNKEDDELFVDIISPAGEIVFSQTFPLKSGIAEGGLVIPESPGSGMYKLQADTKRNIGSVGSLPYAEDLEIFSLTDVDDMMAIGQTDSVNRIFYSPEGGVMTEGLPNQLGFVSTDTFNNTIAVKGKITDEKGHTAGNLKSEYEGYGSVFVMPKTDIQLQAVVASDTVLYPEFPRVQNSGYSVMVNNLRPNTIEISVNGTLKLEGKKFYILMISNGILYDRRIGILTRGLYKTEIPKTNMPSGISQMLLADDNGIVRCIRPVFCDQPDEAFVKYYLAKKEFGARERIDLVFELKDENGKALSNANVSVSVLDQDKISRDPLRQNIISYLNLGYLADYKLEKPGELFDDADRETLRKLDLVILNQHTLLPQFDLFESIKSLDKQQANSRSKGKGLSIDNTENEGVLKVVKKEIPGYAKRYIDKVKTDRSEGYLNEQTKTGPTNSEAFSSPDYSKKEEGARVADLRSTIYWNPTVITNKKGRAKISFYNSDTAKNLQITIEGISQDGLPIFDIYSFGKNASKGK